MRLQSQNLLKVATLALSFVFVTSGCQKSGDLIYSQRPIPERSFKEKVVSLNIKAINTNPEVDVIWVIDNSFSMDPYQRAVIANTSAFISNFTANNQLLWKMGLVSTSVDELPYVGFNPQSALDWKSADPVGVFQKAVGRLGVNGDSQERMFEPVLKAIALNNFIRPNAYLAVLVVTDEEEQSESVSPTEFVSQLIQMKGGDSSKVLTYGIFQDFENCGNSGFRYTGSRYEAFMQASSGTLMHLCDPNFGANLAKLGQNLVSRVPVGKPTIPLDVRPKVGSIKITYNGVELKPGTLATGGIWLYDAQYNIIVFHNAAWATNGFDVVLSYEEDNGS